MSSGFNAEGDLKIENQSRWILRRSDDLAEKGNIKLFDLNGGKAARIGHKVPAYWTKSA